MFDLLLILLRRPEFRCMGLLLPVVCLLAGCAAPLVRSDRLHAVTDSHAIPPADCDPLFPDRIYAVCQPVLHYLAGPFVPRDTVEQYQSTVRPPHSKFHPVPTQPVFSPAAAPPRFPATLSAPDHEPQLVPVPPQDFAGRSGSEANWSDIPAFRPAPVPGAFDE